MANFVSIKSSDGHLVVESPTTLSLDQLGSKLLGTSVLEHHLEELVRLNPAEFIGDDSLDEGRSLLIIGQQVRTSAGGRADLVAVDDTGALVLIELKRDAQSAASRGESLEWQAIRYAASYALIRSIEDAARLLFAPYIRRHATEFSEELKFRSSDEVADKKLRDFLGANRQSDTFNQKQRIVLIAASFEQQVLSSCAWLAMNGVDVRCVEIKPMQAGGTCFLAVDTLLPGKPLDDFLVPVIASTGPKPGPKPASHATSFLRIDDLLDSGVVRADDEVFVRGHPEETAKIVDDDFVEYRGRRERYTVWGKAITGWSAINIYEWFVLKRLDRTLDDLRREIADRRAAEAEAVAVAGVSSEP